MIAAFIVIASAIWAAYLAKRHSPLKAFLNVYLPTLVFFSTGGGITTHGVLITPSTAASFSILAVMFTSPGTVWRFRWTDLFLLLYVLEIFYSDYHMVADFSISGADAAGVAVVIVPPYLMGRYLLETKDARVAVIKRFVVLLAIIAALSLYEYRMGVNPFALATTIIFQVPFVFFQQFRWGFARVGGPFGHAITAGIIFFAGLLFQLWLSSNDMWEKKFRKARWLPGKKTTYLTFAMVAAVWMTQSRGPWMGGALGFILYLAGRARKVKKGITRAILVTAILLSVFYVITDKYTAAGDGRMSQDKENAVYRRALITNYMPIVKAGGFLGYGRYFPTVGGQDSIDNFYLLTALLYGYAGLGYVLFLFLATSGRLLHTAWKAKNREDATFALCLLGVAVGTAATLSTVYLSAQALVLFFMVFGWAQAIDPRRQSERALAANTELAPVPRFAYRRVFS